MSSINYSMRIDLTVPETIGDGIPVTAKLVDDILVRVLDGIGIQVNAIQTEKTGDSSQIALRVGAPGPEEYLAAPAPFGGQKPGAVDGGPEQAQAEAMNAGEDFDFPPSPGPDDEAPC